MPKKSLAEHIMATRPYKWLTKKEQDGAINNIPSMDNTDLERKLDKIVTPKVEKVRDFIYPKKKKRLDQAGR